jgi:PAS domain S-box-containing protein
MSGQKLANEESRLLANNAKLLLESTDQGIYGIDLDGKCTFINRSASMMIGYRPDELLGKNIHDFIHHTKADGNPCIKEECCILQSFKNGVGCRVNSDLFWKRDGSSIYVEYSSYPIIDAGIITGAVVTFNDITERKHNEQELQETKSQAELYLDLMSHDINNMNQIGIGYLEMALETLKISDEEKALLIRSMDALKNSSKLIDNVRKLQRVRSNGVQVSAVKIGDILNEVVKECGSYPDREIHVNCCPPDCCDVLADDLLRDVFVNLVGNAVKHSTGPIVIDINVLKAFEDGKAYYKVIVDDNGPGIPDELKRKIFTRLKRTQSKAEGRGLGLYLVKTLVESYNGRIWVEDRVPGDQHKGSRFVVMLPAL